MASWRDVLKVHPVCEAFPAMPPDQLRALGENIKEHGLRLPIVIWSADSAAAKQNDIYLLDGRNRLDAMEAVGMQTVYQEDESGGFQQLDVKTKLLVGKDGYNDSEGISLTVDPCDYVLSLNVYRRHFATAQERIEAVEKIIKLKPEISSRQAAKLAGVSPTTAVKAKRKLEQAGDVSTVDTSIDTKGRRQPVRKAKRRGKRNPRIPRWNEKGFLNEKGFFVAGELADATEMEPEPNTPEHAAEDRKALYASLQEAVADDDDWPGLPPHCVGENSRRKRSVEEVLANSIHLLKQSIELALPCWKEEGRLPEFFRGLRKYVDRMEAEETDGGDDQTVDNKETVNA
jgi:hypothetical protein